MSKKGQVDNLLKDSQPDQTSKLHTTFTPIFSACNHYQINKSIFKLLNKKNKSFSRITKNNFLVNLTNSKTKAL